MAKKTIEIRGIHIAILLSILAPLLAFFYTNYQYNEGKKELIKRAHDAFKGNDKLVHYVFFKQILDSYQASITKTELEDSSLVDEFGYKLPYRLRVFSPEISFPPPSYNIDVSLKSNEGYDIITYSPSHVGFKRIPQFEDADDGTEVGPPNFLDIVAKQGDDLKNLCNNFIESMAEKRISELGGQKITESFEVHYRSENKLARYRPVRMGITNGKMIYSEGDVCVTENKFGFHFKVFKDEELFNDTVIKISVIMLLVIWITYFILRFRNRVTFKM